MNIEELHMENIHIGQLNEKNMDNVCHQKVLSTMTVAQATEGSYDFAVGASPLQNTGEGGFFIAPAQELQTIVHHTDKKSGNMKARWAFFTMKINSTYTQEDLFTFPSVLPESYREAMNREFDGLFSSDNLMDRYRFLYGIGKILLCVAQEKETIDRPPLSRVLTYIEQHYAEPITVADLADVANLSQPRLFAVFQNKMGTSPMAYLNNYRLSTAETLLIHTDLPIGQIGAAVGIRDGNYFNKLFRKTYQTAPSKFRKIYQKKKSTD